VTLHAYIAREEKRVRGKHHEISLSDLGKVAPDKMGTVIRQPVEER
jgi:hypothetical protein